MSSSSETAPKSALGPVQQSQLRSLLNISTFQQPDFNTSTLISSLTDPIVSQQRRGLRHSSISSFGPNNGIDGGGAEDEDGFQEDQRESYGSLGPRGSINSILTSGAQQVTFEPKPFIRTLEAAIEALLPLRKEVQADVEKGEKEVRDAEMKYSRKLKDLKEGFEAVTNSFSNLEGRISEVGRTAIRIGEQLESIDRLRSRASEAHDIILYYQECFQGNTTRLEVMHKEGGREGRAKAAVIARRLASVAKEVEGMEGGDAARNTIEKYCESFEKDMLRLFDRYYRKAEPTLMAHCAKTLLEFNGGQSCVQIYVNQHDFFISKNRLQEAGSITDSPLWAGLPDPDAPAPKSEPGFSTLISEISNTVSQEAQIVQVVFPNPAVVMQVFLQRVFAQVIQSYVERLMSAAQTSSSLAYLRILNLARSSTVSLVEDIKAHEFFRSASAAVSLPALNEDRALPVSPNPSSSNAVVQGGGGAGTAGVAAVSVMLESAVEELFVLYMERYLEKESKSLSELYAGYLLKFSNWHRAKHQTKTTNTIFDRVVNQIATAASTAQNSASTQNASAGLAVAAPQQVESSRLRTLMMLGGMGGGGSSASAAASAAGAGAGAAKDGSVTIGNEVIEAKDGELSLEVAEKMLKWHAEAVGRMIELTPPSEVPKNAFAMLKLLADNLGRAYIETALDTAHFQIASYDSKTEPDLNPMSVIRQADLTMHLWQKYTSTALIPLAGSSVTVRREMSVFNNHVSVRIEGKVNEIVQKTMDAIISWVTILLTRQKKGDYRPPKNDDSALLRSNTEACMAVGDFLDRVRLAASVGLSGKNLEVFLTEIGVTLHSLLLDHYKKFPVSEIGGIMLTKDLGSYQERIEAFGLPALSERFEMLGEFRYVFIVPPNSLKEILNKSHLGRIDTRLFRPYLMQRSDWSDHPRRFWDDILGADASDTKDGPSGKSRFGSLGSLTKEMEHFSLSDFGAFHKRDSVAGNSLSMGAI